MHWPTSLLQNHITVASSSLCHTVPRPQSSKSTSIQGQHNQCITITYSSIVSLLYCQYPSPQSSHTCKHISEISLESAFSNVILKCRYLIPVFPIEWLSRGYQFLNFDASILLSPETFCQQSISSQHPRTSLLCQRLPQTLSLASYVVPCQLSFKHLAVSHPISSPASLHHCISGSGLKKDSKAKRRREC